MRSRRSRGGGRDTETDYGDDRDVVAMRRQERKTGYELAKSRCGDKREKPVTNSRNRDAETEGRDAEVRMRSRRPRYGGRNMEPEYGDDQDGVAMRCGKRNGFEIVKSRGGDGIGT